MSRRIGIRIEGYRIDKHGRLVRDQRRLSVSDRLRQARQQTSVSCAPLVCRPRARAPADGYPAARNPLTTPLELPVPHPQRHRPKVLCARCTCTVYGITPILVSHRSGTAFSASSLISCSDSGGHSPERRTCCKSSLCSACSAGPSCLRAYPAALPLLRSPMRTGSG
jgi:hypothetical protein